MGLLQTSLEGSRSSIINDVGKTSFFVPELWPRWHKHTERITTRRKRRKKSGIKKYNFKDVSNFTFCWIKIAWVWGTVAPSHSNARYEHKWFSFVASANGSVSPHTSHTPATRPPKVIVPRGTNATAMKSNACPPRLPHLGSPRHFSLTILPFAPSSQHGCRSHIWWIFLPQW